MDGKKRGRIFWLALVGYAVWLTIVLRHAISNNKPVGSLLVLSIVPPLVVVLLWRQIEKWSTKKPRTWQIFTRLSAAPDACAERQRFQHRPVCRLLVKWGYFNSNF